MPLETCQLHFHAPRRATSNLFRENRFRISENFKRRLHCLHDPLFKSFVFLLPCGCRKSIFSRWMILSREFPERATKKRCDLNLFTNAANDDRFNLLIMTGCLPTLQPWRVSLLGFHSLKFIIFKLSRGWRWVGSFFCAVHRAGVSNNDNNHERLWLSSEAVYNGRKWIIFLKIKKMVGKYFILKSTEGSGCPSAFPQNKNLKI